MTAHPGTPERVLARLDPLPADIWDCEACDGTDTMQLRRSSVRPEPCADDVTLKCRRCRRIRTHGVPISREEYEDEQRARQGRTLDMVHDGPHEDVEENLAALGYKEL